MGAAGGRRGAGGDSLEGPQFSRYQPLQAELRLFRCWGDRSRDLGGGGVLAFGGAPRRGQGGPGDLVGAGRDGVLRVGTHGVAGAGTQRPAALGLRGAPCVT